ncbi:MAG TPA: uracil-DNA glycosylase family protein [Gemmatimonadaceae bacterium]|jgi:hypothetical protein|nr:uracil-DNA glycosylase family protein [Gemmatimonadaceae bacterium]
MKTVTFAEKAQAFYEHLKPPSNLPPGVETIMPYANAPVKDCMRAFLTTFFADTRKRVLVLGVNPGRFGAGITGISFTDPIALAEDCGISNHFLKKRELSSQFIYTFINAWGGAKTFYQDFFLSSVSPIGFLKNGVNYNYYDERELLKAVKPFIVSTLQQQIALGARDSCVLLGTGKNQEVFTRFNDELGLFKAIYPVEHPRFIMQYRRKHLNDYCEKYVSVFRQALGQ